MFTDQHRTLVFYRTCIIDQPDDLEGIKFFDPMYKVFMVFVSLIILLIIVLVRKRRKLDETQNQTRDSSGEIATLYKHSEDIGVL